MSHIWCHITVLMEGISTEMRFSDQKAMAGENVILNSIRS
jgi:hypothetical protein